MARFDGITFDGGIIRLDGHQFHDCVFRDVRFDFGAVAPFTMAGCELTDVTWHFVEHAALAFDAVRAMAGDGWDPADLLRMIGLERPPLDDLDADALLAELRETLRS